MSTINNPTPIQASTFDRYWVNRLHVQFPVDDSGGTINGNLLPYDGTNLLATDAKTIRIENITESQNKYANDLVLILTTELSRLTGNSDISIKSVTITAPSPSKPVVAVAIFNNNTPLRIDCFDKASKDQAFAAALSSILAAVGYIAGLPISV